MRVLDLRDRESPRICIAFEVVGFADPDNNAPLVLFFLGSPGTDNYIDWWIRARTLMARRCFVLVCLCTSMHCHVPGNAWRGDSLETKWCPPTVTYQATCGISSEASENAPKLAKVCCCSLKGLQDSQESGIKISGRRIKKIFEF